MAANNRSGRSSAARRSRIRARRRSRWAVLVPGLLAMEYDPRVTPAKEQRTSSGTSSEGRPSE